jgi:hypothetical protein
MNAQTEVSETNAALIFLYLGGTGVALWALVVALEPDVGFVAPLPWMALFWALQISVGLTALQLVLFLITRVKRFRQSPLWVVVIASGVIGSAFLSPLYWLIGEGLMEQVLGFPVRADTDGDIASTQSFSLSAVVNEFGDIVGPVTAAWALISWPRLQRLVPPLLNTSQSMSREPFAVVTSFPEQDASLTKPAWRNNLPRELGDELIAVGSELQYLRVWTTRGSALVLGALQQVEEAEGLVGVRTHRSWWVSAQHVTRVRGKGDGAVCELSNGLEVPVSRRRKAEMLARFGSSASYTAEHLVAASPLSESDQNIRRRPT